jgi:hypothetical protein
MIKIMDPETAKPKTATSWTTITEPQLVEQKILAHNQRHFGQAAATPLATVEIQKLLVSGSTSSFLDQILYQKLDSSYLSPDYYGQQLLAKCSTDIEAISPDITFDAMKQRYRCWTKCTSTSPSSHHLGHYHTLLKPDGLVPADSKFKEIDSTRRAV